MVDVSKKEQLSICLCYVDIDGVLEMFTDFEEVQRITGANLANTITQRLANRGLPVSGLRSQCYDGSSNMSGDRSRCHALIKRLAPKATYVNCASHQLNLAVVSACKIQAFKSTESTIGEIARGGGLSSLQRGKAF